MTTDETEFGGDNADSALAADPEALIGETCLRLMGRAPDRIAFPGGRGRRSAVVDCAGMTAVVTRRRSSQRALLEVEVLRALRRWDAPVPRVIAFEDGWLIQEYLGEDRLTGRVDTGDEDRDWTMIEGAVASLWRIQDAGRRAALEERVVAIGIAPDWRRHLAAMPRQVGESAGCTPLPYDEEALTEALAVVSPRFIKWDSRPGNALATYRYGIAWFDWEHCGCRDPVDDLAWLLGDEWTPDNPGREGPLLDRWLPRFAAGRSPEETRAGLMTFGVLHTCVRLSLILRNKGGGQWWNPERCRMEDRIGVTAEHAIRLCRRGARWAREGRHTAALALWFPEMEARIAAL